MKSTAFFLTMSVSVLVLASGSNHGTAVDESVPLSQIGWQALNLGILLVALIFFVRKSMVETFAKRQQDYVNQAEQTKAALLVAEEALKEIKTKLSSLESGEVNALEAAKKEAEIIRTNLITDAEQAIDKMKKEAQLKIENELAKAKAEINEEILNLAVNAAKEKLSGANHSNSEALEKKFIQQLEQVRP